MSFTSSTTTQILHFCFLTLSCDAVTFLLQHAIKETSYISLFTLKFYRVDSIIQYLSFMNFHATAKNFKETLKNVALCICLPAT
jgi:hypothetical protein